MVRGITDTITDVFGKVHRRFASELGVEIKILS